MDEGQTPQAVYSEEQVSGRGNGKEQRKIGVVCHSWV
jgi:hypothetical protein